MNKFYYHNKRPGKINCIFLAVTLVFIILSVMFFVPDQSDAEQFSSLVTYLDSIVFDEEGDRLSHPSFVMVVPPENEIYVIDRRGRITIYTSDFFPVYTIRKTSNIQSPQGMALDNEGNIYIAQSATEDNPRHRISVFRQCLKWKYDIYMEGFEGADTFSPHRLVVDKKGFIYVAASFFPGVVILDKDGRFVDIMSPEERGKKVNLTNVTLDGEGNIYLLSEEAGRVYVYDENRKFLFKFGEKGGSSGKLSRPKAVAVDDRNGRKYIVDYMRHTVTVYDKEGNFIYEFGGMGWSEGWFQYPVDITIDSEGRIFVADLFNDRVQIFNSW